MKRSAGYDGGDARPKRVRPQSKGPVSTVHLVGFPADFKSRELRNLVRFLPHYEGCHLKPGTDGAPPAAWVKFAFPAAAIEAAALLDRCDFDTDIELRCSMARRDLTVHNPEPPTSISLRAMQMQPYGGYDPSYGGGYGAMSMPMGAPADYHAGGGGYGLPLAGGMGGQGMGGQGMGGQGMGGQGMGGQGMGGHGSGMRPPSGGKLVMPNRDKTTSDLPADAGKPCDTICVRGIQAWNQQDLQDVLQSLQGFNTMLCLTKRAAPIAFGRFTSIDMAELAVTQLQGCILPGASHRLSVQFANRSLVDK